MTMDAHTGWVMGIVVLATLLSVFALVRFTGDGEC